MSLSLDQCWRRRFSYQLSSVRLLFLCLYFSASRLYFPASFRIFVSTRLACGRCVLPLDAAPGVPSPLLCGAGRVGEFGKWSEARGGVPVFCISVELAHGGGPASCLSASNFAWR